MAAEAGLNRLTIIQGDTTPIQDTVKDQDGTVINLTTSGITGVLNLYLKGTLLLTKAGVNITPASGLIGYTLTKTETAALPISLLEYETEYTYPDTAKFTGIKDFAEVVKNG